MTLMYEEDPFGASQMLQSLLTAPPEIAFTTTDPALVEFAHELAFTELVPFEASAPIFRSLASISIIGGVLTAGTKVGLVAAGATPFVLITVPLGIILCGAAILTVGYMIQKLMEPPAPATQQPSTPPSVAIQGKDYIIVNGVKHPLQPIP
jgi:hypothetical protein